MQRAEAHRDAHTLRTYEFLHATFGEFLVARHTWRVLNDLAAIRPSRLASHELDDAELYSLLSFATLSTRRPVIDFLIEMAGGQNGDVTNLIARLFATSQEQRVHSRSNYEPVRHTVPQCLAIYSVNLVLLATIVQDRLDARTPGIAEWYRLATFWKSQLAPPEWGTLQTTLVVHIEHDAIELTVIGRTVFRFALPSTQRSIVDAQVDSHLTGDSTGSLFRYMVEPLIEGSNNPRAIRATVELTAAARSTIPGTEAYADWSNKFPTLVVDYMKLDRSAGPDMFATVAATPVGRVYAFTELPYDQLGRGGPDSGYITVVLGMWRDQPFDRAPVALLDAWLRLHEQRFDFAVHGVPDLHELAKSIDIDAISASRPNL